jgi:TatD DNase family protein
MPSAREGLVDSHAHLDMKDFDPDREQVLERAREKGVSAVLCPAEVTQPPGLNLLLDLGRSRPEVKLAAGVHPHQAKNFTEDHLTKIRELATAGTICALGEVGLDFHYDFSPPEAQRTAFRRQVALAGELGLPLIIHTRKAGMEVAEIMAEAGFQGRGVLHCYTEGWDLARRVLDKGFYLSFTGILTFPKADDVREVARRVPLDRVMVETDSPYLVPEPWRGRIKRNEPWLVAEIARVLAEVKGLAAEDIAAATTRNFAELFNV